MASTVVFHEASQRLATDVQDELLAHAKLLAHFGPVLLVAADKRGNGARFYTVRIRRADARFDAWLAKEIDDGGKPRGQAGRASGRPARKGRRPRG